MCTQQNNSNIISFDDFTKKANPVFMLGVARSGPTLTYNIMKFHPQVLKLSQDTYFFTHFWNIRDKILLSKCELTNDRTKSSGDELKRDINLQKTLINLIKEGVPKKIFSFTAYISYVRKATNKNSAITWRAEKTNNHLSYYQTLKNWFPLCKFII